MGCDIQVTAPCTHDHTWDANPLALSAPVSPSEFWDNITIPYSAYFPVPRDGSPKHQTPPPASAYQRHRGVPSVWDQPIQTREYTPEPVCAVKEPVASTSALPPPQEQLLVKCHGAACTTPTPMSPKDSYGSQHCYPS